MEVLSHLMARDKALVDAVGRDIKWVVFLTLNVLSMQSE